MYDADIALIQDFQQKDKEKEDKKKKKKGEWLIFFYQAQIFYFINLILHDQYFYL